MAPTISYQDCSAERARNASTPHVSTSGSRLATMQRVHFAETSFRGLTSSEKATSGMCVTLLLAEPSSTQHHLKMGAYMETIGRPLL